MCICIKHIKPTHDTHRHRSLILYILIKTSDCFVFEKICFMFFYKTYITIHTGSNQNVQ